MNNESHANEPQTVVIRKQRPLSAGPKRTQTKNKIEADEDIKKIEKPKLDVATRISQARILKGYKTRQELAKALNMNVDIINNIESRKGNLNYSKENLNKICQHLKIKST